MESTKFINFLESVVIDSLREHKVYRIDGKQEVPFYNNVDYCVGTGRMGLALHQEYQEQLKLVQEEIGFRYIRGHGLFSDDMAIYQEYQDDRGEIKVEYNFTYLDMVMDNYQKLGIRPFLELGFMPQKMSSGDQTVFYWQGNVTPPKNYKAWCELVTATLHHLMERYGEKEVVSWPIEVWNEPNLSVFWKDADKKEYFKLFYYTFQAIKALDIRFQVGGPAICGVQDEIWIREFLDFCEKKKIALDFVTRHHYTTEVPEMKGHYGYAKLSDADQGLANLKTTREIIDSFEAYRGLKIHITEFNTSYIPNCPLHDTNQNAAYIAYLLSRLGDVNESYSYWTFGDIFEEQGVPFTPFHGGFGLVANGCIPKPTFWTFRFYKELKGTCIYRSENMILMRREKDAYCGIAWMIGVEDIQKELEVSVEITEPTPKKYTLITRTVDEETCNPLRLWHNMGEPSSLDGKQKRLLKESARPFLYSCLIERAEDKLTFSLFIRENGVIFFELQPVKIISDRGYYYK